MRIIYKPFGLLVGLLGGAIARTVFSRVWRLIDDEDPPTPTTERTSWPKVLGAALLQGAIFRVTRAATDRAGAVGWSRLTGAWPGKREPDRS